LQIYVLMFVLCLLIDRWPVPKAEWLYPCTDDRCDEIVAPDPIVIRTCEDSYYLPALDESELRLYYGEE
jgi:hypothetical protein